MATSSSGVFSATVAMIDAPLQVNVRWNDGDDMHWYRPEELTLQAFFLQFLLFPSCVATVLTMSAVASLQQANSKSNESSNSDAVTIFSLSNGASMLVQPKWGLIQTAPGKRRTN